jgi:cellulose synthase/poly-beta-1,6-N-acetylglucosamine synthase-like glycosyltransferase
MLLVGEVLYYGLFILLAIPVLTFCIQILVAVLPGFRKQNVASQTASVALLIPAHNEAAGISDTLTSIKKATTPNTRIVVIADNCTDNTAEIARSLGAEVAERSHETLRGKGFALDFGIKYLSNNPPEIVIVFDADCLVQQNTVNALVQSVINGGRAVQALYLIQAKSTASVKTKLSEFAYVVKSWTRPLGFYRLGLPMQLMGSGMAFPWAQISQADFSHGSIVEDMKLGIDLAGQQLAPKFCPEAFVTSVFPEHQEGEKTQRKRWEHGHLGMIIQEGLPLLGRGIKSLDFEMVAMALDLCVPPVALLFLLSGVFGLVSFIFYVSGNNTAPWILGIVQFLLLSLFVLIAWLKHGTKIISLTALLTFAPVYALSKIKMYISFFGNRQTEWVKSRKD